MGLTTKGPTARDSYNQGSYMKVFLHPGVLTTRGLQPGVLQLGVLHLGVLQPGVLTSKGLTTKGF